MDRAPPRRNSMLQPLAQGRVQAEAAATPTRGRGWGSTAATGALPTPSQQQKLAMVPHKYAVMDSQTVCEGRGKRLSSPSTLVTSGRPSSSASVHVDRNHKRMSTQSRKHSTAVFNGIKGANAGEEYANKHNNDSDSSDDDGHTPGVAEVRRRQQFFKDAVGPVVYEDGGLVTKGNVDHRGITPHVTFTSAQTPPSEAKNPLVKSSQPVTCGFCSSTNLLWVLRCSFCGSARMSDAPRLKYLIDMILSIDPTIKPEKRILDYAKFDRVAMKAESTFKQAGLVRAKAAIMMMNRTILILRFQIMGMVFGAWKKLNVNSSQQDTNIQRVISIKEAQEKRNLQKNVFAVWKGYVSRVTDERLQRFAMAYKRYGAHTPLYLALLSCWKI
ncbi:hypothetical protein BBJ28_00007963 [Nothophytophthora sp. Chile5]|nr:hypothetical protein BBJ28_00007963 [Nothophytophthora sp. Chile5]